MSRSQPTTRYRPTVDPLEPRALLTHAAPPGLIAPPPPGIIPARSELPVLVRNSSDPFANGPRIQEGNLRAGDIIVSADNGGGSKLIRTVTFSSYSHAAIYIGGGRIIDATPPPSIKDILTFKGGVRERDLSSLTTPAGAHVGVIRATGLTVSQVGSIVGFAQEAKGKSYNFIGIGIGSYVELIPVYRFFRFITGHTLKVAPSVLGPGLYCSELVIRAYKAAGITVAPERGDTPAGIVQYAAEHSGNFQLVGRLA